MKPLCKYIFDHFERDFTFSSIDLSNIPSIDNLVSKICIYFVLLLIWVKNMAAITGVWISDHRISCKSHYHRIYQEF